MSEPVEITLTQTTPTVIRWLVHCPDDEAAAALRLLNLENQQLRAEHDGCITRLAHEHAIARITDEKDETIARLNRRVAELTARTERRPA